MEWQTLTSLGRMISITCICFHGYSSRGHSTISSTFINNVKNVDQLGLYIPL
jgi:hypothetical protein